MLIRLIDSIALVIEVKDRKNIWQIYVPMAGLLSVNFANNLVKFTVEVSLLNQGLFKQPY